MCGRDQPGDGRCQREAGFRATRQDILPGGLVVQHSIWNNSADERDDRDLLPGDQRPVLLADSEAAPWVGVLADDERVDRQQRQQHVPSLPVEDGGVLAKSNSMKLCMANCKTPVKGQHRSILMVSNKDKDTLYITKICAL